MKSVILCEGQDDLWFLAYYLNKTAGWDVKPQKWKGTKLTCDTEKQQVVYMWHKKSKNCVAIKSADGEANLLEALKDILVYDTEETTDPIHAVVLFCDCDTRNQEELAQSMEEWFDDDITLCNNHVSDYLISEQYDFSLKVLPLVIPFDEEGAIETLLLKSIADDGADGAYVAAHAKAFIEETKRNVTAYLSKQREFTKAKYAAAMAIIDPTHSRDTFNQLMNATPWETSCSIHEHMELVSKLISGQLELAEV